MVLTICICPLPFFRRKYFRHDHHFKNYYNMIGIETGGGGTDFYTRNQKSVCSALIIIMSLRNVLLPLETLALAAYGDDRLSLSTVEICWLLWIQMKSHYLFKLKFIGITIWSLWNKIDQLNLFWGWNS
jgi:hypothetical protein